MNFEPTIHSQQDLEDVWRRLMGPLGFSGRSLWLMLVDADGHPVPHLSQIEQADTPPELDELAGFADIVRGLRADAARLPPADLVRQLAERSGLLAALKAQCKTDQLFKIRRGNLDELADWFDHASAGKGRASTRPGLSKPCGSSACLIWRIRVSACTSL